MLQSVTIVLVCVLMVCGAPPQIATVGSAGLEGSVLGGTTEVLDAEAGGPAGMSDSDRQGVTLGTAWNIFGQPAVSSAANPTAQGIAAMPNQVPHRNSRQNDFFDNVFNIPISTLQAVSQLLGGTPKPGSSRVVPNGINYEPNSAPSTNRAGNSNTPNVQRSTTFFDDIFNIPISALRSVNDLLNGKNAG